MSLDHLLGGHEHYQAMKSIRDDLFYIAYISEGINFMEAKDVYTKEFNRQEKRLMWKTHSRLPDWYPYSMALQKLEEFVSPGYHISRYNNEQKNKV